MDPVVSFRVGDVAILDDLSSQGPFLMAHGTASRGCVRITVHYLFCSRCGDRRWHVPTFALSSKQLGQLAVALVFLVALCELPDYVTQYVQSTLELFLSQCYLLLPFNKAFPTASGHGWPALCASALGLVLLWKLWRKPVGRLQNH